MLGVRLLVLLLLLIPVVTAQDSLFDHDALTLKTTITNKLELVPTASDYVVQWLVANVSWFPLNDSRQTVLSTITTPSATVTHDNMEFRWENPTSKHLSYEIVAVVETSGNPIPIKEPIPFPIGHLENQFAPYLKDREIIDITPQIRRLAQKQAQGGDDLFEVVFKLAKWTKANIAYNLTSLNVEASQSASWVLEHREGVCDELTSLFVAMVRSLGIPAKFIAGISYTDLDEFDSPWGPHGWAEVYFPQTGWVPFDVTYGQYGYVDATHIKLKETLDAKQATVRYTSKGRHVSLDTSDYDIVTEVLSKGKRRTPSIDATMSVLYTTVGPGSFNLVTVELTNTDNFYRAFDIQLAQTTGLDTLDDLRQSVFLPPRGETTVTWIIQQSGALQQGYLYTFPIEVHLHGQVLKDDFTAKTSGQRYIYDDIIQHLPKSAIAVDLSTPELACSSSTSTIFLGMDFIVGCTAPGSEPICMEETCVRPINGKANFTITLEDAGVHTLKFNRKGLRTTYTSYVTVDVQMKPDITIDDIKAPTSIDYDAEGALEFTLHAAQNSLPRAVVVRLEHEMVQQEWKLETLETPTRYRVIFDGRSLDLGENIFTIRVNFKDQFGKEYERTETVLVEMKTTLFLQRVSVWLNKFWSKIDTWLG